MSYLLHLIFWICDKRIAGIFGDKQAVAATAYEPGGVDGIPNNDLRNRLGARGEDPARGVMHLFSNSGGTPRSGETGFAGNLFVPRGFSSLVGKADDSYLDGNFLSSTNSNIQVSYAAGSLSKYGWRGDLTISFVHAGPVNNVSRVPSPIRGSNITNAAGSQLIGTIGADGSPYDGGGGGGRMALSYFGNRLPENTSDTPFTPKNYIHNHVIFYTTKGGKRVGIDPRKVFCGDLGF